MYPTCMFINLAVSRNLLIQNSSENTYGWSLLDHVVLVDVHIGLIFNGLFKYYISLN